MVDHVPWDCELVMEETFGPAIPVIRIKDIDDAIRVANGTNFGLSSGVCSNRFDYITRFINELNHGTVNIWEVPGYQVKCLPSVESKTRTWLQRRSDRSHEKFYQP